MLLFLCGEPSPLCGVVLLLQLTLCKGLFPSAGLPDLPEDSVFLILCHRCGSTSFVVLPGEGTDPSVQFPELFMDLVHGLLAGLHLLERRFLHLVALHAGVELSAEPVEGLLRPRLVVLKAAESAACLLLDGVVAALRGCDVVGIDGQRLRLFGEGSCRERSEGCKVLLGLLHGAGENGCLSDLLADRSIQVLLLLKETRLLPVEGFLLLLFFLLLPEPCEHDLIGLL